jgi:hypothetical protein
MECISLLCNIVLHIDVLDKLRSLLDPIKGYSVSGVYHFLTTAEEPIDRGSIDNILHK